MGLLILQLHYVEVNELVVLEATFTKEFTMYVIEDFETLNLSSYSQWKGRFPNIYL